MAFLQIAFLSMGIIIAHVLLINKEFRFNSRGYIIKAIRRIWYILLFTVIINFALACFYCSLISSIKDVEAYNLLYFNALLSGYISVVSPHMLLKLRNYISRAKKVHMYLTQNQIGRGELAIFKEEIILNFNKQLQREIERIKLIDRSNFLTQTGWWDLNLNNYKSKSIILAQNRLRFLYEKERREIAESNKIKYCIDADTDNNIIRIFRVLVELFGRTELRTELLKDPKKLYPNDSWFGEARRTTIAFYDRSTKTGGRRFSDTLEYSKQDTTRHQNIPV